MSIPQSLPSFAQAFSNSSLSDVSPISNALPPIQSRPAHSHSPPTNTTKKRSRQGQPVDPSPLTVRIKVEDSDDSPPQRTDSSTTPAVQPLSKRRRVTVSGGPSPSAEPTSPLPDDARTVLAKQPQKTLADQHRGSMSVPGPNTISLLAASPPGDQSKPSRVGRISPTAVNRCAGNPVASGSQATTSSAQPLTPPPLIVSAQSQNPTDPASKSQQSAVTHSLPPPPISFARRRAAQSGGRKKKPADILISPRGAGPSDPLAPVIQSAPPVADPGRFPMAIPRLPLVLNNTQTTRRVAGNVPPTPTRFSLQGTAASSITSTSRPVPSPPNLSVPISAALVPPTPHALHHPGYTGDKPAFLAPFEVFYDALNDSKQLKGWLSDQLQKSNALMTSLKQQQDKMDEIVEDLLEKRTRVMREEITMLRQRMESLEEAVLAVRAEASASGQDGTGYGYPQSAKFHQNGVPEAPPSYRFPAPEQRRPDTDTSPGREQEHRPSLSPPVEVTRRLSVSATTARSEPTPALHGSFTLGVHNRCVSGSQGSAKCTPHVRPQAIPERPSSGRQADSRPAGRLYFPGSYGNSHPPEGQASSRGGDKS